MSTATRLKAAERRARKRAERTRRRAERRARRGLAAEHCARCGGLLTDGDRAGCYGDGPPPPGVPQYHWRCIEQHVEETEGGPLVSIDDEAGEGEGRR